MDRRKNRRRQVKRALSIGMVMGVIAGVIVMAIISGVRLHSQRNRYEQTIEETEQKAKEESKEKAQTAETDPETLEQENAEKLSSSDEDWDLVLISESSPLPQAYVPELTEIQEENYVDARIADQVNQMFADMAEAGLSPTICSSYRSYESQQEVFNENMNLLIAQGYTPLDAYSETKLQIALPGTSEHATGLALDIISSEYGELDEAQANTAEAQWLAENCADYGFILRYPSGKSEITGITYEPWHYRYVGEDAAKEIMEKGLTLEEYLESLENS